MANLLVEIGCEELPAGYLEPALRQWASRVGEMLKDARLGCEEIKTAGTPRRMTVFASGVRDRQEDVSMEVSGPPAKVAFDADGNPTKAAIGFAKSQGIDPASLKPKKTDRGEYAVATKEVPGRPALEVLAEELPKTINAIRFPKSMRWVTGSGTAFARPYRRFLALLDEHEIEFELNGVRSGRTTIGHPFLSPEELPLVKADFDDYIRALEKRHVVADIPARRAIISEKINSHLKKYGTALQDHDLLDEVTNLVEFPNIVEGTFEEKYLKLPEAVLEESMKSHQRYFPVRDADGKLLPKFMTIINRDDRYASTICEGNERVLRARLADADFFLQEDKRRSLADRLDELKSVTFQAKLGSYYERVLRLKKLAASLAKQAGLPDDQVQKAVRAAELSKNDLVTNMVGEFPKLQGVVGREYALHDGEDQEVADAIAEHYAPRGADDAVPESPVGCIVSLAEKFDAMLGCFAVGLQPTGSQDPYALRRAAQGILRILMERELNISLRTAALEAQSLQPKGLPEIEDAEDRVLAFLRDRLYNFCTDKGYRYDQVNAVLATGFDDVRDTMKRLDAVAELSQDADWEELVTVVQRTRNIIKNVDVTVDVEDQYLEEPEEKKLFAIIEEYEGEIIGLASKGEYKKASRLFAESFVKSVHEFFDKVFVNVDNEAIKHNRHALMKRINGLYTERIADLSEIVLAEE